MKAITSREKALAKYLAKEAAAQLMDEQAEDITNRAQCMVFASMLNAGLSVKTVNRVIDGLAYVVKGYGEMRKERLADYDLIKGLIDRGVNVHMTENEL